ncbi:NAD(P)/FAD-dependent oxidoreductase [Streptomyces sp. B6B3]|uniref:flavin-containing monooxygenase n=1 Tax=Streptomyces sp. B6B3 TaxID=3153570 RepID=UPI00325D7C32
MSPSRPPRPPAVDDETLRRRLAGAEIPALLMTVAHLTGDPSVLREDLRAPGWLFAPQGGLTAEQQAEARETAFRALARLRDQPAGPPAPPDRELLRAITSWAMGGDTEDLLPLLAQEIALPEDDPKAPGWSMAELRPGGGFHVAIIGAGFSGLLAGYRLAQAGVPYVIYEKNADVGGTWFENTYPGCRTDVASHLYNYSFAPKADWPEHFCRHDVVHDYLRTFAKESGVADRVRFGTEVTELRWDDEQLRWQMTLDGPGGRRTVTHHAVVSAVGQLNRPRLPDIPGRDDFAGPAFHSAAWDHTVSLAGKRVAVIGTGASAYQLIPEIVDTAAELVVVQRNPPWLRPTPHYRHAVSEDARWLFAHLPYYTQWYRFWLFAPGLRGILEGWVVDHDYPPTEQAVSQLNDQLRATLRAAMEAQLADAPEDLRAELLPALIPRYPVGAKRVLRDDGRWIATLRRDDVRLVTDPVERIDATGLVAGGRHHDVDVIVYATGFEASRFLTPMTVRGRDGRDLHTYWNGVPRAYLGITVPGFPNLFTLYGPNTNLVGQGGSIVNFSECATGYVLDAVRLLLAGDHRALDLRQEVLDRYQERVEDGNANRAWGWTSVSGWYNEGGRSVVNWPFTAREYWELTSTVDPDHYETL